MKSIKLIIKTKTHKYPILIGSNLISKLSKIIKNNSIQFNKCLFIIDSKIPKKFIFQIKKSFKDKEVYFNYINVLINNRVYQ